MFYIGFPIILIATFYLCTWDTFHTGSLNLGYINGPTEGIIISVILFLITSVYGTLWFIMLGLSFWQLPFSNLTSPYGHLEIQLTRLDFLYYLLVFLFFTYQLPSWWECSLISSAISVIFNRKPSSSHMDVLLSLFPMFYFSACFFFWAAGTYSLAYRNHPVIYMLSFALVFGRITTKIILSHVTSSPFPYFTVLMIPIGLGSILANFWSR